MVWYILMRLAHPDYQMLLHPRKLGIWVFAQLFDAVVALYLNPRQVGIPMAELFTQLVIERLRLVIDLIKFQYPHPLFSVMRLVCRVLSGS